MRDGTRKAIPLSQRKPRLPGRATIGRGFFLEHRELSEVSAPASEKVPPLVRSGVSSSGPLDRGSPGRLVP